MSHKHHDHIDCSSEDEHFDDEDVVEDLSEPAVVSTYQAASVITNKVLKHVISLCTEGKNILDICTEGDKMIEDESAKTFNKRKGIEKGLAFPTCISVNNCVGHFSPLKGNTRTLAKGDVVKIDLGCQIDGFIAVGAHTIIIGSSAQEPMTGKTADAICAAHYAMEAALRLIRPGNKNTDVTDAITKITNAYSVNPVQGILSHELKRFTIDGEKVIFAKVEPGQKAQTHEFQENEVYCIDIVVSTGEGKAKEGNDTCTIYKRNVDQQYLLKLKSSREFISEVNKRYPALPFPLRNFDEKKARMGLSECVNHGLLTTFPVLYDRPGTTVVQFKTTVLVLPSGNQKIVGSDLALPFVRSEFSIQDPAVQEILSRSLKASKKKTTAASTKPTAMDCN
ncbi:hypothetical protein CYY_005636 [Polysphondylium violaceum]|uniref:Peptidase M24 domain-containing protein n=1 Tax=Polysphondylium violaceum TaxID=133409 RepID=A0A8J4PRL2_9MYCE|nr:hypothetical protein CYY_005636 [Polysphondylium violaceum]